MQWLFVGSGVLIIILLSFALKRIKHKLVYFLPLLFIIIGIGIVGLSKVFTFEGMRSLAVLVVGLLSLEIGFISLIVVYMLMFIKKKRKLRSS